MSALPAELQKIRQLQRKLGETDILSDEAESLYEQLTAATTEILMRKIGSRADAYTILYAILLCGTYERPIRRALMHVLRFLAVG